MPASELKKKTNFQEMMIDEKRIQTVAAQLESASDRQIDDLLNKLWKKQPHLQAFTEAMLEVFEDEEDFLEECHYYWLFVDLAFDGDRQDFPAITPGQIEKALQEVEPSWQAMEEAADPGDFLENLIARNPQSELLFYFFDDIFASVEEVDDNSLALLVQLMMYVYEITAVYQSVKQS